MLKYATLFLFLFGFLLSCFPIFSQIESGTWLLNGKHSMEVFYATDSRAKKYKNTYPTTVETQLGYFFRPNTVIGAGFDFSFYLIEYDWDVKQEFETSVPIFARQYFFLGKVKTFASIQADLNWDDYFFMNGWLGAGINIFLMENIALEGSLNYKFSGRNFFHNRNLTIKETKLRAVLGLQFYVNREKATAGFNGLEFAKGYFQKGNYILGGKFAFEFFESNDFLTTRLEPSLAYFLKDNFIIGGSLLVDQREPREDDDPIRFSYGIEAFAQLFRPLSPRFYFSSTLFAQNSGSNTDYQSYKAPGAINSANLNVNHKELVTGFRLDIHYFAFTKNLLKAGVQFAYHQPYGDLFEAPKPPVPLIGSDLSSKAIFSWQYLIMRNFAFEFSAQYEYLDSYRRLMKDDPSPTSNGFENFDDLENRLHIDLGLFYYLKK